MKICINPACRKEISDNAKFCGYCRTQQIENKTLVENVEKHVCPKCKATLSPTAKFCAACGTKISQESLVVAQSQADSEEKVDNLRGYVTWSVLPGQLAAKIEEKDIAAYGKVKGLYIAPGTKALFFVNGKFAGDMESGTYPFKEFDKEPTNEEGEKKRGFFRFIRNVANFVRNGVNTLLGRNDSSNNTPLYSVVLYRGVEFPLIFDINKAPTSTVSCDIGVHVLGKIANINQFFESLMLDTKMISFEWLSTKLSPAVTAVIKSCVLNADAMNIGKDEVLNNNIFESIKVKIQEIYPYITLTQIISITSVNEELEKLRRLKEELYIAEEELVHLQKRNNFMNRLQGEENANKLREARSESDFKRLMNEIVRDDMKNEDEMEAYALMLAAERELREAKSDADVSNALDKIEQTKLLSKEELETLRTQVEHRRKLVEIGNEKELSLLNIEASHLIAMATLQNEKEQDRAKLQWEIEIGNKRLENELLRSNMQLDNELAQQRKRDALKNEQRYSDLDYEKKMAQDKLELLKAAQDIRREREDAEFQRELERKKAENEHEIAKIHATNEVELANIANEKARIEAMAGMTAEQIMVMNPNVSPEAAKAMAERWKAEAAAKDADKIEEMSRERVNDVKDMMAQSMEMFKALVGAQVANNGSMMAEKQRELDRVHADAERNNDRILNTVTATVSAMSPKMPQDQPSPAAPSVTMRAQTICPSCGAKCMDGSSFCEECGNTL